jgi:hypothetical protein
MLLIISTFKKFKKERSKLLRYHSAIFSYLTPPEIKTEHYLQSGSKKSGKANQKNKTLFHQPF